jgi:hypothetical protein
LSKFPSPNSAVSNASAALCQYAGDVSPARYREERTTTRLGGMFVKSTRASTPSLVAEMFLTRITYSSPASARAPAESASGRIGSDSIATVACGLTLKSVFVPTKATARLFVLPFTLLNVVGASNVAALTCTKSLLEMVSVDTW